MSLERNSNKKKSKSTTTTTSVTSSTTVTASTLPKLNDNNRQLTMPVSSTLVSPSSNYPLGISFSSNIANMNESDDVAYIEKRTAHNALERQRREGLNTKFQELAHVLPALQQIRRPSKSMIVAKSLEFVSNAGERENDFQGQIHALRKENEQLMRQASLSRKRIKKRLDQDTKEHRRSPSIMIKLPNSKKRSSKMKPQSRQPNVQVLNASKKRTRSDCAEQSEPESSLFTGISKANSPSPPLSIPTEVQQQQQQQQQQPPSPPKVPSIKRRKRNATVETYQQQQAPMSNAATYYQQPVDRNEIASIDHNYQPQQRIVSSQRHRFNSHPPTTANILHQQQRISPVVSRHNSLTLNDQAIAFDFGNTGATPAAAAVTAAAAATANTSNQFSIIHSPFGNEHIFFNNTFDSFDNIVSTIPALTTPSIGNNVHLNTPTSSSPASSATSTTNYDNHLDLIHSIMQSQDPTTDNQFYQWH